MAINPTYKVTTVLSVPYVMEKSDGDGYQGFIVDMLDKIAQRAGFKYQLQLARDGMYGSLDTKSGIWSGMIGELVREDVELAAADLSITSTRESVVDFSKPFLSQSVKVLAKKPMLSYTSIGNIFEPFSTELWLCILIALVIVALLFMLIGRFNPYEWRQVPSDKDPRGARHSFGLRESLMFVFSTLTLQGYRETPRSLAGRVLTVTWFIFVFLTVSAFISVVIAFNMAGAGKRTMSLPFDSLEDLTKQTRIKVGMIKGGATFSKMEESKISVYQKLVQLRTSPDSFVNSIEEGVKRVRQSNGDYVMMMESLKGEYIVGQVPCDVMMIGPGHFMSALGLATPKGSHLKDKINLAILELREDGTIQMLKKKWWYLRGQCPVPKSSSNAKGGFEFRAHVMSTRNMAAPFLILLVGAILSVVVLAGEILFKKMRQ